MPEIWCSHIHIGPLKKASLVFDYRPIHFHILDEISFLVIDINNIYRSTKLIYEYTSHTRQIKWEI